MRDYIKDAPILALTATATDQVANDIQNNLKFYQKNKIQSSFIRDNLSYILIKENNKKKKLIEILNKIDGSSIIYVNSRNQAEQIDKFGMEVIPVDLRDAYAFGGGLHCCTADVFRKGTLKDYFPKQ